MNQSSTAHSRYGLLIACVCFGLLLGNVAWGQVKAPDVERKEWNAEDMQRFTAQLVQEMSAARQAARREPLLQDAQRASSPRPVRYMENLRQLERTSKQLASRVSNGGGFEETQGIARKFGVLLRDSEVLARSLSLSKATMDDLAAVQRTVNQIAPFYGKGPLYPEAEAGDGAS